jgi:ferredoxin
MNAVTESFIVKLAKSGQTVEVGPGQSIVEALEDAGVVVPTSCLAGLCATCKTGYSEGEVEHNDFILSDEEKQSCLTLCVSRARVGSTLVLDL